MGMDHGVWIACGSGVWIRPLNFDLQPYVYVNIYIYVYIYIYMYGGFHKFAIPHRWMIYFMENRIEKWMMT